MTGNPSFLTNDVPLGNLAAICLPGWECSTRFGRRSKPEARSLHEGIVCSRVRFGQFGPKPVYLFPLVPHQTPRTCGSMERFDDYFDFVNWWSDKPLFVFAERGLLWLANGWRYEMLEILGFKLIKPLRFWSRLQPLISLLSRLFCIYIVRQCILYNSHIHLLFLFLLEQRSIQIEKHLHMKLSS